MVVERPIEDMGGWYRTHYSIDVTPSMDGKQVIVCGWVRELRDMKKIKFIKLADREGFVQILAKVGEVKEELIDKIADMGREWVIAVKGTVRKNKEAPGGREIIPIAIKIVNKAEAQIPLEVETKKTPAELPTRLDWRFIDLRKPEISSIFSVKDAVTTAVRNYLEGNGFIEIHTPKIIAEASEGGSEVFKVKYFGREAYLAQSPQFYKQMMMAAGFDKVYEIAPAFRAELSRTTRHVAEIIMLDMEMSFINSTEDVMHVVEDMMVNIIKFVDKNEKRALEILSKKPIIPKTPFPRITVAEAKELLKERNLSYPEDVEIDREGEKALGEIVAEKYGHEFVFLTEFPWAEAKFYHRQKQDNPKVTERCDLIYNGVEIATVTQREHRYEVLLKQAKEKGTTPEKIKFYLNAFRYGMPPHGGCGVGIDRIVQQLLQLPTIQEAVLFPRTKERITP